MKQKFIYKAFKLFGSITFLFLLFPAFSQENKSLIKFTQNKHQWDEKVKYKAQLDGGALFLQNNTLLYHFYDKETFRSLHGNPKAKFKVIKTSWFNVKFLNANDNPVITSSLPTPDVCNFFIGNDKNHWASNVRNYQELMYHDLYNGIDLQILGKENSIKYNFIVSANTNTDVIQLNYEGIKNIELKRGEINISTEISEITEHEPYAYQVINGATVEVPCKFKLLKNTVSFVFPKGYNKNYQLVIDPTLVFACSSGSTADNFGMTATYDANGNLYSGGTAFDVGFPVVNAYDSTYNSVVQYGQTDVVITKYDSSGTFLQYSTYLGGSSDAEVVNSLIVDQQNNLYALGVTASSDFPMVNSYDATFNGGKTVRFYYNGSFFEHGTDMYVAKLSSTGSALLGSTFMGGSANDGLNYTVDSSYQNNIFPYGNVYQPNYDSLFNNYGDQNRGEIQIDNAGDIVIASSTRSADFPIVNGFDAVKDGVQDAVVYKLSSGLNQLKWSTYLGGSSMDAGYALYLDAQDNVFVTGGTTSTDFTTTTGAYKTVYNGGKTDGYIAKIKSDGTQLLHATYIGTSSYDQCYFVQLDGSANVFVFGQTNGVFSVVNAGYSNTNGRQFVSKLDSTLSTLLVQTKIGNGLPNINISPSAFLVDCAENIYLSGWGGNILGVSGTFNMPLTANAHQSSNPDGFNFYLMVLSKNANSLLYATYFGGPQSKEHVDGGTSRFDKKGIIYQSVCAGCGNHDDFPVTPGSWPTSLYGNNWNQSSNCNNGTFKFDFEFGVPTANFSSNILTGCSPLTVQFNNTSISAAQYMWNFGNNDTTSMVFNPSYTFTTPGTYTVSLAVHNQACYNIWDTAKTIITVYPGISAAFATVGSPCSNHYSFTDQSVTTPVDWHWNFGDGVTDTIQNPAHNYATTGTYTVTLIGSNSHCIDSTKQVITNTMLPQSAFGDTTICYGAKATLHATGGTSYSWSPTTGLNNPTSATPIVTGSVPTVYTVTVTSLNSLGNSCSNNYTVAVNLHPRIIADFNLVVSPCGNTVQFTDSSYMNPVSWHWNYGDTYVGTSQNPVHSYATPGTYSVTLIAANNFNCPDTTVIPLTIGGFTPLSVNASVTICKDGTTQLNATGGIVYSWSPAATLSATNIPNPVATPDATTTYSVDITSINTNGDTCQSTLTTDVTISSLTGSQLVTVAHPSTIVNGQSSNITSSLYPPYTITWAPTNTLSDPTSFSPVATPHHTTTYSATVVDASGCTFLLDDVTITVIGNACDEGTVFLPNTFTPNGDGKNDVLYVRSNFVTELYFAVYNRWGQMVFETTDITKGWDGIYNGMKADPGVFGYYLKVKCNNGDETFRKGNVTLIR